MPTQLYPEINCIVPYIMYDICNLIFCIDNFHIRQVITPMDQTNAKWIENEIESVLYSIQTCPVAYPAFFSVGAEFLSRDVRLSVAEVNNAWRCTAAFHGA
jgi:hypothetical protein